MGGNICIMCAPIPFAPDKTHTYSSNSRHVQQQQQTHTAAAAEADTFSSSCNSRILPADEDLA